MAARGPGIKAAANRLIKPIARSVVPKSSAAASEVIAPPSNAATTSHPSTGANPNKSVVQYIGIGASLESLESRCDTTTFADSALRCEISGLTARAVSAAIGVSQYRVIGQPPDPFDIRRNTWVALAGSLPLPLRRPVCCRSSEQHSPRISTKRRINCSATRPTPTERLDDRLGLYRPRRRILLLVPGRNGHRSIYRRHR